VHCCTIGVLGREGIREGVCEVVLRSNAFATIPSPVRSFGLLTAIAVALAQFKASRAT